jgi:protein gp37
MGQVVKDMSGKFWDNAWTLVEGCTPVSEGCDNCWLAAMAFRFGRGGQVARACKTQTHEGAQTVHFTGNIATRPDRLDIPLRTKQPTVFAVWSDLFHESVPMAFIEKAIKVMTDKRCEEHTFLVITKRPERLEEISEHVRGTIINNLWVIATAENQVAFDDRVQWLDSWVWVNPGIIIEPCLGPVDLFTKCLYPDWTCADRQDDLGGMWCGQVVDNCKPFNANAKPALDLVILGGETGLRARPMQTSWARTVRDQCQAAGVPFFFKSQGGRSKDRRLDGELHDTLPWRKA